MQAILCLLFISVSYLPLICSAQPQIIQVEYQIRSVEITDAAVAAAVAETQSSVRMRAYGSSKQDDASSSSSSTLLMSEYQRSLFRKPISQVYTAAIINAYFDEPIYLQHGSDDDAESSSSSARDGEGWNLQDDDDAGLASRARKRHRSAVSIFDIANFMKLKPEYRQVLYGLTRLSCPSDSVASPKNLDPSEHGLNEILSSISSPLSKHTPTLTGSSSYSNPIFQKSSSLVFESYPFQEEDDIQELTEEIPNSTTNSSSYNSINYNNNTDARSNSAHKQHQRSPRRRRPFRSRFPRFLLPLPQAKYSSFQWLNIIGQPEFDRTNTSVEGTNVLSYLLLLQVEHVHASGFGDDDTFHDNNDEDKHEEGNYGSEREESFHSDSSSDQNNNTFKGRNNPQHKRRADNLDHEFREKNFDGSISRKIRLLPESALPQCKFELLPHSKQGWKSKSNITNFHGQISTGFSPLQSSVPARRMFHFSVGAEGDIHDEIGSQPPDNNPDDENLSIFLSESLTVQHRVGMGLSVILMPVFDKIMQIVMPYTDRLNEFVVPAVSKGMTLFFDGEGAPGTTQPGSRSFPGFLEIETTVTPYSTAHSAFESQIALSMPPAHSLTRVRLDDTTDLNSVAFLETHLQQAPAARLAAAIPSPPPFASAVPALLAGSSSKFSSSLSPTTSSHLSIGKLPLVSSSQFAALLLQPPRFAVHRRIAHPAPAAVQSATNTTIFSGAPAGGVSILEIGSKLQLQLDAAAAVAAKAAALNGAQLRAQYQSWRTHLNDHPENYLYQYRLREVSDQAMRFRQTREEHEGQHDHFQTAYSSSRLRVRPGMNDDGLGSEWVRPRLAKYFWQPPPRNEFPDTLVWLGGSQTNNQRHFPRFFQSGAENLQAVSGTDAASSTTVRSLVEEEEDPHRDPLLYDMRFESLSTERMREKGRLEGGGRAWFRASALIDPSKPPPLHETEPGPVPILIIIYLIRELTTQVTIAMTKGLSDAVHEDVFDLQVNDMRDYLREEVIRSLKRTVVGSLSQTLPRTVPDMLERYLPVALVHSLTWTLTQTMTRAITHSLSPAVALSMARPVEEQYVCSECYYNNAYCEMCSWNTHKKNTMLLAVDYLADYWGDLMADHYTGENAVTGLPYGDPFTDADMPGDSLSEGYMGYN